MKNSQFIYISEEEEEEDVYEVESIIGMKADKGVLKFNVKWKSHEIPTWQDFDCLDHSRQLISTYLRNNYIIVENRDQEVQTDPVGDNNGEKNEFKLEMVNHIPNTCIKAIRSQEDRKIPTEILNINRINHTANVQYGTDGEIGDIPISKVLEDDPLVICHYYLKKFSNQIESPED